MDHHERRAELGRFLRARRERLTPQQAGLPAAGRRRTPGLRREELAMVAGVGESWYTWLEQGRAITVSPMVLDSLARALQLDAAEREHLFILARGEVPAPPTPVSSTVSPAIRQIVDALQLYPAYVANARWDAIAWNCAACEVFADFDALPSRDRNLLRYIFSAPQARQRYADWEQAAQHTLALFRASTGRYVAEAWFRELVAELSDASEEFAVWWARNELRGKPEGAKKIEHPSAGRLEFETSLLQIGYTPDLWLIVYTPWPTTDTAAKLQQLLQQRAGAAIPAATAS